jgi:hypothetical protein
MKITINTDTSPHTIEVHGKATLGELIAFLSQYYPDFTWKDVAIGDKSFMQAPITTGQWWDNTPSIQPLGQPHTGSRPIIYGTGTTGAHSAGTSYTSAGNNKASADLFDSRDTMGIQSK